MHAEALLFAAKVISGLDWRPQTVVDLGGANWNGSPRVLLPGADYRAVDVFPGDGVDVVADAASWQPSAPVEMVICMEVLEHATDPAAIVANAARMLRRGGVLILTCAGPGRGIHGAFGGAPQPGEPYANVDPSELADWLAEAFGDRAYRVEYHAERGDVYASAVRDGAL